MIPVGALHGSWLLCPARALLAIVGWHRRARWMVLATVAYAAIACAYRDSEAKAVELPASSHGAALADGVAITPDLAQALYGQLAPLREADGCQLVRFDTGRSRIAIGLRTRSGRDLVLELATARRGASGRTAGGWALAVPEEVDQDCGVTLAAIEHVLRGTPAPRGSPSGSDQVSSLDITCARLAASFMLLALGSCGILYREAKVQRPPWSWVLALVLVWAAALALRLTLSPRTFLHEYYHIAETVSADLTGKMTPVYGNTGPALFRVVGAALGRPDDVRVIFLTNAVLASLAIPAVALLDLVLMRSWPRALTAAVLLCVLPQHLRFSAAEDLFVQAVTFGVWALALFALYVRTRRLEDALLAAVALSLAMQTRPEMVFFPAALVAFVLLVEPHSWRVLFARRTLLALSALGVLLIPRFVELQQALHDAPSPTAALPAVGRYFASLVLLQPQVTPVLYWVLLAAGLTWGARRKPGIYIWVLLLFVGYTLFSLSVFNNPPYNLRSQLLPTSFVVLVAAGAASLWMELWERRARDGTARSPNTSTTRRLAVGVGAAVLVGMGTVVVVGWHGFVTELRDQQLEWAFLERTVPRLPERATLLSAVEIGGRNLDAFPTFLLSRHGQQYELVDVRRAANSGVDWPTPGEDLLYYQGMFCYFAFSDEPSPEPMTAACRAVHERYVMEPLFTEDLETQGYSLLRYAGNGRGPFRIGFFRLRAGR